jgi:hypothetical protein
MSARESLIEIANNYFNAFANKDLIFLEKILDDNVVLFDPIIQEVKSKKLVLQANQNIFSGVEKIFFEKKEIFIDSENNTIVGQLKINFDGKIIDVVDIISVNNLQLIDRITAYLDSKQIS